MGSKTRNFDFFDVKYNHRGIKMKVTSNFFKNDISRLRSLPMGSKPQIFDFFDVKYNHRGIKIESYLKLFQK